MPRCFPLSNDPIGWLCEQVRRLRLTLGYKVASRILAGQPIADPPAEVKPAPAGDDTSASGDVEGGGGGGAGTSASSDKGAGGAGSAGGGPTVDTSAGAAAGTPAPTASTAKVPTAESKVSYRCGHVTMDDASSIGLTLSVCVDCHCVHAHRCLIRCDLLS